MTAEQILPHDLEIIAATLEQQPILANLLQLYAYDLSDLAGLHLEPDGRYLCPPLSRYWQEATRFPFLVKVDGHWGGFILLSQGSLVSGDPRVWDIAEFFVLRRYRRHGIGANIAQAIWRRFPGSWEVRVLHANQPARLFWQRAIDAFTGSPVKPVELEQGGRQRWVFAFESAGSGMPG